MATDSTSNSNDDIFSGAPVKPAKTTKPAKATKQSPKADAPAKKSHVGLFIGLGVGALVIAGGATAFAVYRSQPAVVAADSIVNFINARHLNITGTFKIKFDKSYASEYGVQKVILTIEENAGSLPSSTKAKLEISSDQYGNYAIDFNNVLVNDGTLYLQVDGVEDAIDAAFDAYLENNFKGSGRGATTYRNQYRQFKDAFEDTLNAIDGTWWEISLDELIETVDEELDIEIDNDYSDAYKCVISQFDNAQNNAEIGSIYRKYPFITVNPYTGTEVQAEAGGKLYTVNVDPTTFTKFTKDTMNSDTVKRFNDCFKEIDDFETFNPSDITASEWDEFEENAKDNLGEIKDLYLEIDNWSHNLTALHYSRNEKHVGAFSTDLKFNYNAPAVSAPQDAKSITKLIEIFASDYTAAMHKYYEIDY